MIALSTEIFSNLRQLESFKENILKKGIKRCPKNWGKFKKGEDQGQKSKSQKSGILRPFPAFYKKHFNSKIFQLSSLFRTRSYLVFNYASRKR